MSRYAYPVMAACAMILAGCGRVAVPIMTGTTPTSAAYVRMLPLTDAALFRDAGLDALHFEVKGAEDRKVTIWIETWMDGKRGDNLTWGAWETPAKGRRVEEMFRFTRRSAAGPDAQGAGKVLWQFGFDGTWSYRSWMDDPLAGFGQSTEKADTKPMELTDGRTVTVWYLGAAKGGNMPAGEESVKLNPRAILIKCRMDAAPTGTGKVGAFISGVPPAE